MKKIFTLLSLIGLCSFAAIAQNTAGTLSFSVTPSAVSGTWQLKHDVAIWITNNAGTFIKTKAEFGTDTDHLTSWIACTPTENTVDATTGPTINGYTNAITISWNGTDVNGAIVPDGIYKVWVEMGWGANKTTAHAVTSFSFTKGTSVDAPTLSATTNFLSPTLTWTPTSTGINEVKTSMIHVFPNPATDVLSVDFEKANANCTVKIMNLLGEVVMNEAVEAASGIRTFNISTFATGTYIVNVRVNGVDNFSKFVVSK